MSDTSRRNSRPDYSRASGVGICALVLLAANLRPALTGVGPLIDQISQATGISLTEAGLLGSLPLVALGLFAPLAHIGRNFGPERVVVAALLLLVVGMLVRSHGSVFGLFAGTACLAAGIALGNVLGPAIIKRDFPDRIKGVTTIYAITLALAASIASGLAVPFSEWLPGGWQTALSIWILPAIIAVGVWSSSAGKSQANPHQKQPADSASAWRSGMGWLVTGFMASQSLMFYVVLSWFPTVLQSFGLTPTEAGLLLSLYLIIALPVSATMPFILARGKDQTIIAAVASLTVGIAAAGLLAAPAGAYVWMVLLGIGGGATFTLSLSFISLRAASRHEAASLSIMSHALGYTLAASGPIGFGVLHDVTGSWTAPLVLFVALAIVQALIGLGAGRDRTL